MCMCGKPTINGQFGYSWNGEPATTRQVNPPPLVDGDVLIYDEPGRCGGIDAHSHHFRLVKARSHYALLVRHGGGDERIGLGCTADLFLKSLPSLGALDSNARYWLLHTLHSLYRDAAAAGASREDRHWRKAAAEKRIKTRKRKHFIDVWIEAPEREAA